MLNFAQPSDDDLADIAMHDIERGAVETALDILQQLVNKHPEVDRYQFRLGLAFETLGRWNEALACFKLAIGLNPTFGVFHHKYMTILVKVLGFEGAIQAYEKAGGFAGLSGELRSYFAQVLLTAGCEPKLVLNCLPGAFGLACANIEVCPVNELPRGTVQIRKLKNKHSIVAHPSVMTSWVLNERLQSMIVYFDMLSRSEAPDGAALLSLDDLPPQVDGAVLCFSGSQENELLVPDALFVGSHGYRHLKTMMNQHTLPWAAKQKKAYWRGALTGIAGDLSSVMSLPRVTLAKMALDHDLIDAKITDTTQFSGLGDAILDELNQAGILGARENEVENFKYRWMIDVDGNSNAWAGFFLKLLTNSPVIKLTSPMQQWYYNRISAGQHYIAIDDLEIGLPAALDWCNANNTEAQEIGARGGEFIRYLTVPGEFESFKSAFLKAV